MKRVVALIILLTMLNVAVSASAMDEECDHIFGEPYIYGEYFSDPFLPWQCAILVTEWCRDCNMCNYFIVYQAESVVLHSLEEYPDYSVCTRCLTVFEKARGINCIHEGIL